jgi:hypothetical protein
VWHLKGEAANAQIHRFSVIDDLGIRRSIPLFMGMDISAIISSFLKEATSVPSRRCAAIPRDRDKGLDDAQRLVQGVYDR